MDSVNSINQPKAESDKSQERSTIEFPYTDLESAVEVSKGVHNAGGTACDSDQLAAQLVMEAKGGGFRLRINGAQTFGLVTYERGGRVVLTDMGRQLVDPATERSARMNAFINVPLYCRVYEEFKGGPLPPHAALERAIENMGVGAKVKDRARQVMLRSAKQAGFFEHASDRLIKPVIRESSPSNQSEGRTSDIGVDRGPSAGKQGGGSGNGTGDNHPLIQGLILTLPKSGSQWPAKDRTNWLTMASSIFKMIYEGGTDGEIEIKFKDAQQEKQSMT